MELFCMVEIQFADLSMLMFLREFCGPD